MESMQKSENVLNSNKGRLLVSCPDKPGIVAAVSQFLYRQGANIVESNQYSTDPAGGTFFMRIEFECEDLGENAPNLKEAFTAIAENFEMDWRLSLASQLKKTAIFVSKEPHCLLELLWEYQSGELDAEIALVVSNHEDSRTLVESLGIPYHYIPANKDIRKEVEEKQLQLLEEYQIELIVLARYMQILTPDFVSKHPNRIINIHHSFLPAFIGAKPYERAYGRGVKLIGATSHYVTNDLDEGPIIEQGVERVSHHHNAEDLKRIGRSVERSVLARAVNWHLQDRVIVHENKTIVFH
ncbi:formyltetrahydrofolate deformylase [Fictibacillus sp. WQ 8-8]|uniref:formyltetrahydrofolate deformylase n=1 Tax=Fictibacillus sp. WQ 8-8 TaxID=2938788 RepID=UPI00210B6202|nr:formyltetrahydrofolate deformylase [Fictibacillus sp. WQ 8-8]MCQ6264223.1 formyltetrahydrofolate deformylase [Fictibacillus sp. WQ 8-8]